MDKVQKMLDEVLVTKIESLGNLSDDERAKAVEELSTLHKMRIEEKKIETAEKQARIERVAKEEQAKSQKIDRWIELGLQAGLTIGGWIMFSVWQGREQKFEMTGTPSSPLFRNLLSRMTPNLKK